MVVGAFLAGCSKESSEALRAKAPGARVPVTLGLDWYPEAEQGGFYQALARGYYRDAGLDVTIQPGGPGNHPVPSLAVGKLDFSVAASDEVVMDVANGMPLVIVGAFLEHNPQALLVRTESRVRTFADLDGKTVIGVPGAGWMALVQKRLGIHFSVVPMGFEISRFLADPSVIQQCYITNEPYYVKKAGVRARTLLISDSGYDPYRVMIVNRAFLRDHPDWVAKFVSASVRGWADFAYGDPKPAIDSIVQLNAKTTREYVEQSTAILRNGEIIKGAGARDVPPLIRTAC
jgi:NitT/TauT family transport system substrate-binding protein